MTKTRIRTAIAALAATFAMATVMATSAAAIPQGDPYDPAANPDGGAPSVSNTYNCRYWSGGVCVQRSCTAGGGNNCQTFSQNCVSQGHTYNGGSQQGTCSRQNLA